MSEPELWIPVEVGVIARNLVADVQRERLMAERVIFMDLYVEHDIFSVDSFIGEDMNNPTIQVNNSQLVETLAQFPPEGLKRLIDQLFKKKLYTPLPLAEITREASRTVKRSKLAPETAAEAVLWARSQK